MSATLAIIKNFHLLSQLCLKTNNHASHSTAHCATNNILATCLGMKIGKSFKFKDKTNFCLCYY